ncbi:4'-phosphopantetheinyl transferase family protein [Eubacteriales bacterium KG126]
MKRNNKLFLYMGNNLSVNKQIVSKLVTLCENDIEIPLVEISKGEIFPQIEYETNLELKPELHILNDESLTYLSSHEIGERDLNQIEYNSFGKPFFPSITKDFSISHTQLRPSDINLWGCLVGDKMVGLDIQANREVNWLKISKKYFSYQENLYIKKTGKAGFFQLWTRKEALGKALGKGFFYECDGTVSDGGYLLEQVNIKGTTLKIANFKLGENIWGAWCFVV